MAFRRKVLSPRTVENAQVIRDYLLPPFPISHITITFIIDMTAVQTAYELNSTLWSAYTQVEVCQRGKTIVLVGDETHSWLNAFIWGFTPDLTARSGDNLTARVGVSVFVPFGRRLYDPTECLPAAQVNDTVLRLSIAGNTGNMTTKNVQIEVVELPDAQPTRHLIYEVQTLQTPVVGFVNRITLPRSDPIVGILLAPTNQAKLAGDPNTIERFRIEADAQEHRINEGDWYSTWPETKHRQAIRWMDQHEVIENIAAAYTQNAESRNVRAIANRGGTRAGRRAYLDFDPLNDGQQLLDGSAFNDLDLIIDAGDTNAINLVPVRLHNL